jgi:hypothetical protein
VIPKAIATDGTPWEHIERATIRPPNAIDLDSSGNVYTLCFDPATHHVISKYDATTHGLIATFCDSYAAGKDMPRA